MSYTFVDVQKPITKKYCAYCGTFNSYINGNCKNCGGNEEVLIEEIKTVKERRYIPDKTVTPSKSDTKNTCTTHINEFKVFMQVLGFIGLIFIIPIIIAGIILSCVESAAKSDCNNYSAVCTSCGHEVEQKAYTYWNADGTVCNGSEEYNKEHAHHIIMYCDYCGNSFKYILN